MIGNWLVVTWYQFLGNSFAYDFQRHKEEMTQAKLVLHNKLNYTLLEWVN